jgi:NAD-dependent deacetylase
MYAPRRTPSDVAFARTMGGLAMNDIGRAADAIRAAQRVICLSGAGISVASGIPHFRSAGGLWTRMDPMEYATRDAFVADPAKVWTLFRELEKLSRGARPNAAHEALARLEAEGFLDRIITQNVDGLHQAAGSMKVTELHGSGHRTRCTECFRAAPREPDDAGVLEVPRCDCGGLLKLDVILFGEALPVDEIRTALAAAEAADLIVVIGTSATVAPASTIPMMVASHGGQILEMNQERTVLSDQASLRLEGDLSQTLPALAAALLD